MVVKGYEIRLSNRSAFAESDSASFRKSRIISAVDAEEVLAGLAETFPPSGFFATAFFAAGFFNALIAPLQSRAV